MSGLYRKELFEEFDYDNEYIDDYQLWLKIAYKYKIGFVNEYLARYRKHDNYMSGNILKMISSEKRIIDKYKSHSTYHIARDAWNLKWFRALAGVNKKEALKYLRVLNYKKMLLQKVFWISIIKFLLPKLFIDYIEKITKNVK